MESGKGRRYRRLMGTQDRTVIVATDDGLISGPTGLLTKMGEILKEIRDADGVLMYRGHLERNWVEMGQRAGGGESYCECQGKDAHRKGHIRDSKGSRKKRSGLGSGTRKCGKHVRKQDD